MNVKRESRKVTEEMLKSFMDAFNRHDLDEIMSFFAEDCSFDMPRGHIHSGQDLSENPR